jgi:Mce-associated membrane protein
MWPRTWAGVLAVLALFAGGTASAARQTDNLAFVDPAKTQTAVDQGSAALAAVLSYDYRKLDESIQLAKEKGTDAYVGQHTELINTLRPVATKQKQSATTKVVGTGVRELRPDTAKLVIFYDQTVTRGDTNKTAKVGLTAVVDLRLVGELWKLDNMNSFGS